MVEADGGNKVDQIDLKLALKSLPNKVDKNNVYRCEQYTFEGTKTSLISYQNDETDELFKFYDNRNK